MSHTFYEESYFLLLKLARFLVNSYGINSGWSFEPDERQLVQLHFMELSFI